jgi:trehalose 6-phosphate synthase
LRRLVVVSNRVAVPTDKKARAGGLAVGLQEALKHHGGVWFGWSGRVDANPSPQPTVVDIERVTYATMDLSRKSYAEYYNGFANRALWPLFHFRLGLAKFDQQHYSSYLRVNRLFAEKLLPLLAPDDLIWVHDYHLIPLGSELRRTIGNQSMGFFLHTPFPPLELLVVLPAHRELMRALCSYDVVGFQTVRDLRAFLDYVVYEGGGEVLDDGRVRVFGHTLKAESYPIGIDTEAMVVAGVEAAHSGRVRRLRERARERTWIIGVDRLDYSKGIVERFRAFEMFLEKNPKYHRQINLIQIAPPSRAEVPEYMDVRRTLEAEAGRINSRFAEVDWVPINYLGRSYTRQELAGFYRASRVGLVTPLRDGMNFVAKEFIAAQDPEDPGVLVLSRFAGAARELTAALIVNPFDFAAVADAIAHALAMPLEERRDRWQRMMERLRANSLTTWRDRFLAALAGAPFGDLHD